MSRNIISARIRALAELMERWRANRDRGQAWSAAEQVELEALTNAETAASGQRAALVAI